MSFKAVTQELKLNKCRQNREMGKNYMNREGKHKDKSTASLYHDFNGLSLLKLLLNPAYHFYIVFD